MTLKAQARKRMLILICVVLLVGGGVGGALAYREVRMQRLYADIYRRGMNAVEQHNDSQVVNFFGQYLRRYPADLIALRAYAKSRPLVPEPHGQHLLDTAGVLRHLLQIDPSNIDDWRQLMKLYYQYGMMTEANDAAKDLLARVDRQATVDKDPQAIAIRGEAMAIRANVLVRLQDYAGAEAVALSRLKDAPDDWNTQINLLVAKSKLNKSIDDIRRVVEQMKAAKGYQDTQGSLLVQAVAYELTDDQATADAMLQAAASKPYQDKSVAEKLVHQLNIRHFPVDSMKVLTAVAQTGDIDARRVLIRRLWEDNRVADAAALCAVNVTSATTPVGMPADASAPAATQPAETAVDLANIGLNDLLSDSETLGIYEDCLKRLGKTVEAGQARDALAARHDDTVATAWATIAATDATPTRDQALALRAACADASEHFPGDPYLLYFEGAASAALGDTGPASTLWGKSAQTSYTWSMPLIERARIFLSEGRRDDAARDMHEAVLRSPSSVSVAIMQATVWFAETEAGEMSHSGALGDLIDEIQRHAPGEEQTLRMHVALLAGAGKKTEAVGAIEQILQEKPAASPSMLLGLNNISLKWKLGVEAECLKAFEDHYGRSPESVLAIALNDYSRQQGDQGLKLLQDSVASAAPGVSSLFQLALVHYLEYTQDPNSTAQWVKLGDAYPNDLSVQRGAIASQAAYRDRDFFDRTITRVQSLLGDDSTVWKLGRARWLLDLKGSPGAMSKAATDAETLLQQVLRSDPDSIGADLLMAQAKTFLGDVAGATTDVEKAQKLDPNSATYALDMARLLQVRGDFDAARQQLDTAMKDHASPDQQVDVAMIAASTGDIDQAIKILEPLAARPEASEKVRIALASFYCRTQQLDKAQAICDVLLKNPDGQAIILAAELDMFRRQPQAADQVLLKLNDLKAKPRETDERKLKVGEAEQAMGDFRYSFGQLDAAAAMYRKAADLAPTNAVCWLSLMDAQCLLGKPDEALVTGAEALKHVPGNPQIIAIQQQADLIAKVGAKGETRQRLLSAIIQDPSPTGPAVTTLKRLADEAASDDSPDQVIQNLKKLSQDFPRFLPAQTVLIETELALGRCDDAVQAATRTVAAFPNEPLPAQLAVTALQSLDRSPDALAMAQTWKSRLTGDTLDVDLTIAQLDIQRRDPVAASAALKPHLDAPFLSAEKKWRLLLTQGQAMAVQGNGNDAVALLWPLAQTSPQFAADWMRFVVAAFTADQADQAGQWLSRMDDQLKTQPNSIESEVTLAGIWNVLAKRMDKKEYAKNARDLIHRLEQNPDPPALALYAEGGFDEEDGDLKGAEVAYRKAIAKNLPEAGNNLANMIAAHGGDLKEAIALARECIKNSSNDDLSNKAAYYDTLAALLDQDKDYGGAADAMRNAMTLQPNNAKWHVNLIKMLLKSGKRDEARKLIAEVDLMTPGMSRLNEDYKKEFEDLRKQANADAATPGHAAALP